MSNGDQIQYDENHGENVDNINENLDKAKQLRKPYKDFKYLSIADLVPLSCLTLGERMPKTIFKRILKGKESRTLVSLPSLEVVSNILCQC